MAKGKLYHEVDYDRHVISFTKDKGRIAFSEIEEYMQKVDFLNEFDGVLFTYWFRPDRERYDSFELFDKADNGETIELVFTQDGDRCPFCGNERYVQRCPKCGQKLSLEVKRNA